jgi:hypothetical protein
MKSRKHNQLKRNPLVRFIRGVFRLLRVILKPKNRNLRSLQYERSDLPQEEPQQQPTLDVKQHRVEPQQLDSDLDRQDNPITVGELFEQIKWQISTETTIQANTSYLNKKPQSYDVSRN